MARERRKIGKSKSMPSSSQAVKPGLDTMPRDWSERRRRGRKHKPRRSKLHGQERFKRGEQRCNRIPCTLSLAHWHRRTRPSLVTSLLHLAYLLMARRTTSDNDSKTTSKHFLTSKTMFAMLDYLPVVHDVLRLLRLQLNNLGLVHPTWVNKYHSINLQHS